MAIVCANSCVHGWVGMKRSSNNTTATPNSAAASALKQVSTKLEGVPVAQFPCWCPDADLFDITVRRHDR